MTRNGQERQPLRPRRIPGPWLAAWLAACCLALAGCTGALPASGTASPYPTATADITLQYPAPDQDQQLPLRVFWPTRGGPHPVLVFSHGGGSAGDQYDRLARHWAAAGYVVILPTHRDSRKFGFDAQRAPAELMVEVLESRRRDLVFIVDELPRLPDRLPGLAGRVDGERIAVGGHSMGGATALTVTGLVIEDVRSGHRSGFREPRFDALLLLTEPGNSPMMPVDPWRAVPIPVFVATGSKDYSGQWNGPPRMRFQRFPAGFSPPAGIPRHYLFIQDMDHYLGGLVCRSDVPGPLDEGALHAIQAVSTRFLDAYLKEDQAAAAFLREPAPATRAGTRAALTQPR